MRRGSGKGRLDPEGLLSLAGVLLAVLWAVWLARPEFLASPGIAARTDLGGHAVAVQYLLRESLPRGHLLDWSHQWFGGYPSFYFYFPLPALLVGALSLPMPLNVAVKLVAILAPAALPVAAYFAARSSGADRTASTAASLGALAFLSLASNNWFGGNVLSSVTGEYSFSIGLAFATIYLGLVSLRLRGRGSSMLMSVVLAAAALSHVIPTIFAVAGSLAGFRKPEARRAVLTSWFLGFGLTAFWAVPFLFRSPYMIGNELPHRFDLRELVPLALLVVLPWSIYAAVLLSRKGWQLGPLLAAGVAGAIGYLVPNDLVGSERSLPVLQMVMYVLVAMGIAVAWSSALAFRLRLRMAAAALGTAVFLGVVLLQTASVRKDAARLLTGAAPDSAAFDQLAATLSSLPYGRAHIEHWSRGGGVLGERLTTGRLPAYDARLHTSIGLLRQSARASPAYYYLLRDLSWDAEVPHGAHYVVPRDTSAAGRLARLRTLGVTYLVTVSPEGHQWAAARQPSLTPLAWHPDWVVWRVEGVRLVEAVAGLRRPRPGETAISWLENQPGDSVAVVTDGPVPQFRDTRTANVEVRDVVLGHRMVRFTTSAPGIPHVVRVGYFPNWRASGADGPYPVLPGFMSVIPTQAVVTLRFERTWVEWLGSALTTISLVLLLAGVARGRGRARVEAA